MTKKKEDQGADPAEDLKDPSATGDQGDTPAEDNGEADPDDAEEQDQDPDVNDSADPDPEKAPVEEDQDPSEPLPLPEQAKSSPEADYPVLGRKREAPMGHGSHDAAVSGYTTDASGSYTPPGALKE